MTVASLADQAAIGDRLARVAKVFGSGESLHRHLLEVTSGVLVDPVAFTDADVQLVGISSALAPTEPWLAGRMAALTAGVSGSRALPRAVIARHGALRIERMIGVGGSTAQGLEGGSATLAITGPATLDDDVAAATDIGLSAGIARALGDRLAALTGDRTSRERMVRVTVFSSPEGHDSTIELATALTGDALAAIRAANVTEAQRRLLERVHPILAAGQPVWVRCGATAEALDPHTTLVYAATPLAHVRSIVTGLATSDAAVARFAAVAAGAGADQASAIELAIGPLDPMRLRISVAVKQTA